MNWPKIEFLRLSAVGTRCGKIRSVRRDGKSALLDEYGTKFLDWWHDRLCVRVISTTIPMRHTYNFRLDLA